MHLILTRMEAKFGSVLNSFKHTRDIIKGQTVDYSWYVGYL